MKKAWYIIYYHNISWEENPIIRGLRSVIPPDIFREHIYYLRKYFRIVNVPEGLNLLKENNMKEPLLSIWFDDGYTGVREYAFPILKEHEMKGAVSINSRFILRQEMFWRYKLSLLSYLTDMVSLVGRLEKFGYKEGNNIGKFVLDNFSEDIYRIIDEFYKKNTDDIIRREAFSIFDTMGGLELLKEDGWTMVNHSSSHCPLTENYGIDKIQEDFDKCEKDINKYLGMETEFFVIPFGKARLRNAGSEYILKKMKRNNKTIVLTEKTANKYWNKQEGFIFRIGVPYIRGKKLINYLSKMPIYNK